jgi:hypothetical protein
MSKREGEPDMSKRLWYKGNDEMRRQFAHIAIDLDTPAELLVGYVLLDALRTRSADDFRKMLPRIERAEPPPKRPPKK